MSVKSVKSFIFLLIWIRQTEGDRKMKRKQFCINFKKVRQKKRTNFTIENIFRKMFTNDVSHLNHIWCSIIKFCKLKHYRPAKSD